MANGLNLAAAVAFVCIVLSDHLGVALMMSLMVVFTIGVGVAAPAVLTEAISVDPLIIGSASGLYGCIQMAIGASCTAIAGLGANPALSSASVLAAACVVSQVAFWIASMGRPSRTRAD